MKHIFGVGHVNAGRVRRSFRTPQVKLVYAALMINGITLNTQT
jgi:hypothetical protein